MKKFVMFAVLAAATATLVYDAYGTRSPGEARREWRERRRSKVGEVGDESAEAKTKIEQFAQARTAPGVVLPGAYTAAFASLSGLPVAAGVWSETTNRPYNLDDLRYRDPFASNSGGGCGPGLRPHHRARVAGSTHLSSAARTAASSAPATAARLGAVDRRTARAVRRRPPRRPGRRALAGHRRSQYRRHSVCRLRRLSPRDANGRRVLGRESGRWDRAREHVHRQAALRRRRERLCRDLPWLVEALGDDRAPAPGRVCSIRFPIRSSAASRGPTCSRPTPTSATMSRSSLEAAASACSSTVPGATARRTTVSTIRQDGGQTFARVNPTGALNPQDVGRTTFAYADNGAMLYALVESMTHYTHSSQTALGGVYVSRTGSPAGPWNKIADSRQAGISGSALKSVGKGYRPGIQAWYNQFLDGRPDEPNHVWVGLEEVYETATAARTGARSARTGTSTSAAGRSSTPPNTCPMTDPPRPALDRDR